jgi:hypothetical protein
MNTRSTRKGFSDDEEPDLNERKQTGSILDELIEQRLRNSYRAKRRTYATGRKI